MADNNATDTTEVYRYIQCPPPLSSGGSEKFSMLAKRGGLALFEFSGGGE